MPLPAVFTYYLNPYIIYCTIGNFHTVEHDGQPKTCPTFEATTGNCIRIVKISIQLIILETY